MIKLFFIFLLVLPCALSSEAQTVLPKQYNDQLNSIVHALPEVKLKEAASPAVKLLAFAKTMLGVPYKYASGSPERGFDCSGFVSFVFKNFGFNVPRSSREFVHAGVPTSLKEAKIGDVLIFTGSNPRIRKIGHVGIVYAIDGDEIKFIHATSGKANGVTISNFDKYYKSRFMKIVSIL